jgi:hypothetical protein
MGGHVFADKASAIKREYINPTLTRYFQELKNLFPRKAGIFNTQHFIPLGSVGKKAVSGDIDLGIDIKYIIDFNDVYKSVDEWNLSAADYEDEFILLKKRARSATDNQLRVKALMKLISMYINDFTNTITCDETKVGPGNMFSLFPQYTEKGSLTGAGVQIDWMAGDIEWLKFSYYSSAYSEDSNVKGLHRTQLMLSAFQVANLSFGHVDGVKDKETREVVATTPVEALTVLSERLGFTVTQQDAENYYTLYTLLAEKLDPDQKHRLLCTYFKILDSTRVDIPDNLTYHWLNYKDELGLTGKFLPETSKLKEHL